MTHDKCTLLLLLGRLSRAHSVVAVGGQFQVTCYLFLSLSDLVVNEARLASDSNCLVITGLTGVGGGVHTLCPFSPC